MHGIHPEKYVYIEEKDRFTKYGGVFILAHDSFNLICADPDGGPGVRTPLPKICQRWGLVWMFYK